jgi:hypothetical protein
MLHKNVIRILILPVAIIIFSLISGCSGNKSCLPLLILGTNSDFGSYTGEILKAEGFNEYKMDSLNSPRVTKSYLKKFDLVILAESKAGRAAKELLFEFVKNGGNLIAFRPDPALAELFGITRHEGVLPEDTLLLIQPLPAVRVYSLVQCNSTGQPIYTILMGGML